MSHSIAKLILENARTAREREKAIERALALGMQLHEIEEYLDWLDAIRRRDESQDDSASKP
jgi:DNA-binding transcriptional MerR regulator